MGEKKAYCPKCGAPVFFDNGEAWCSNLHHLPGAPVWKRTLGRFRPRVGA